MRETGAALHLSTIRCTEWGKLKSLLRSEALTPALSPKGEGDLARDKAHGLSLPDKKLGIQRGQMLESALQQTAGDNLPLSALSFSGLLEALLGFTKDRSDRFAQRSQ